MSSKICNKCGRELPATTDYFHRHKNNNDGLAYGCKECINKKVREYQRDKNYLGNWKNMHPYKICTKCKKEKPRNPNYFHKSKIHRDGLHPWCICCNNKDKIARKYGISHKEYDKLFKENNNRCMICGRHKTESTYNTLCIDHDHETEKVRGLLCDDCNQMLGRSGDNPFVLIKGALYLMSMKNER